MRYLAKARLKNGKSALLLRAIEQKTLGRGSIAGDEYLHNMQEARLSKDGIATWVECCFCATPLEEERPYWEDYFTCSASRTRIRVAIVVTRTGQSRGLAATAIAPNVARASSP